ncbi:IMPACT family protein [Mycoplasmopsis glycophila]|uniref:Proline dipeptidase pepQ n=1 Tax=Mycoplasmopsis glycophila TaxID=171285 RepID=A0A449AWP0_9BACT|nr:YigZ family protein [Mycoplasmopsis glycophila]VEU71189.1 proline dipeptidase pepQ [Mycoplasmopsis glycophila]
MIKEELVIKKSRFIAYCFDVQNKEEVKKIWLELKNEHKNARHVCYAYLLYQDGVESAGFNDDAEPKATAGRPIYNLMRMKNVYNKAIFVVRYFGGIKLGEGGLKRAYGSSAGMVINKLIENQ